MPNKSIRKRLIPLLKILLVLLLISIPAIYLVSSHVLLHPKRRALEDRHHHLLQNPKEYALELQKFTATTHDGFKLHGYIAERDFSPGEASRTRRMLDRMKKAGVTEQNQPRGTVILLHGRGGLKENMLTVAQRFIAADFRCIVYDARCHGESEGKFCTFGKEEVRDLTTVLDTAESILVQKSETLGPVVAFGNSLGASVVIQSIPREPRIVAAVASAPFANLREEIIHAIGNVSKHRLPEVVRSSMLDFAAWRAGFSPEEMCPETTAASIDIPVFINHGKLDKVIPIEQGRRVFENLPETKRKWWEVPDGYHGNVLAKGGDDLYEAMIHFYLDAISQKYAVR